MMKLRQFLGKDEGHLEAVDHFLRVAREQQERSGIRVPLLVSDRDTLSENRLLGPAWRSAERMAAGPAFG